MNEWLNTETAEQRAARQASYFAIPAAPTAEEMEIRRAAMFNLLSGNIAATSFPTK